MPHISYSELKIWAECPFKHKLMYIDKIKGFIGNEYTATRAMDRALVDRFIIVEMDTLDKDEESTLLKDLHPGITKEQADIVAVYSLPIFAVATNVTPSATGMVGASTCSSNLK